MPHQIGITPPRSFPFGGCSPSPLCSSAAHVSKRTPIFWRFLKTTGARERRKETANTVMRRSVTKAAFAVNPGPVLIQHGYRGESITHVYPYVFQHIFWVGGGISLDDHDPTGAFAWCIQLCLVDDDLHQMQEIVTGIVDSSTSRPVS